MGLTNPPFPSIMYLWMEKKVKKKTLYSRNKAVILKKTKDKLEELNDRKMTPKKANLVKKLKGLMKWHERKHHAPKRKKNEIKRTVNDE